PSSPTRLSATVASSSQINLTWTAPTDNGGSAITGYKIERSTDGGTTWSTIVPNSGSTSTTYSDAGLMPGTTYGYRVSTINSAGTSPPSNTASATTLAVAPSAPTGLTATAASSSQINLSWTAPNNGGSAIIGYMIERSTNGGSIWTTLVANTGSTATTYSNVGLSPSTTYAYRVSAINSVGTSPPSNTASATTNTGTVSLVTPGLVASDPLNKTATQQQLTANPGIWTFDGSAKAGGFPFFFNEDAQGLHIGVKAPKAGNWSGFYASTQSSTAPFPTLFHALVTAPSRTIPANDFNAGIYVQTAQPLINYVFCGESTSTTLTYWSVVLASGNANQATKTTTLYTDPAPNQPLTRDCTIVTNGQNYLEVFIDQKLVYQSTSLKQNMTTPFIFFLESQTSNAAQVLYGVFRNFYATSGESVVVNGIPAGATMVQIVDPTGAVLATASVSSGTATLPVGQFAYPLKAKIIVYGSGNKVVASTSGVVSIYAGDVYSVH
ncbi:MAG: fibronectin type III domain-containing protein, partial [Thaumarchaeota archaeon]